MTTKYQIRNNSKLGRFELHLVIDKYHVKLIYFSHVLMNVLNELDKHINHKVGIETVMHITLDY